MLQFMISAVTVESGCFQFDFACYSKEEALTFSRIYYRKEFCSSLILFRLFKQKGQRVVKPILFL